MESAEATATTAAAQAEPQDLDSIIRLALSAGVVRPQYGTVTLLLWEDAEHLRQWQERRVEQSGDVRIRSLDSAHLPTLPLPAGRDRADVAFVAAALGRAADYSDTVLQHCLTLERPAEQQPTDA